MAVRVLNLGRTPGAALAFRPGDGGRLYINEKGSFTWWVDYFRAGRVEPHSLPRRALARLISVHATLCMPVVLPRLGLCSARGPRQVPSARSVSPLGASPSGLPWFDSPRCYEGYDSPHPGACGGGCAVARGESVARLSPVDPLSPRKIRARPS